jgi:hypothetical protein
MMLIIDKEDNDNDNDVDDIPTLSLTIYYNRNRGGLPMRLPALIPLLKHMPQNWIFPQL